MKKAMKWQIGCIGGVLPYVKNKPISHEGNKEVRAADYKDPSQMV